MPPSRAQANADEAAASSRYARLNGRYEQLRGGTGSSTPKPEPLRPRSQAHNHASSSHEHTPDTGEESKDQLIQSQARLIDIQEVLIDHLLRQISLMMATVGLPGPAPLYSEKSPAAAAAATEAPKSARPVGSVSNIAPRQGVTDLPSLRGKKSSAKASAEVQSPAAPAGPAFKITPCQGVTDQLRSLGIYDQVMASANELMHPLAEGAHSGQVKFEVQDGCCSACTGAPLPDGAVAALSVSLKDILSGALPFDLNGLFTKP